MRDKIEAQGRLLREAESRNKQMVKRVQGQDDRLRTQEKTLKSYKAQLLAATNKTNAPSYL